MRGWLKRARVRWTSDSLDRLSGIVDRTALHPTDRTNIELTIDRARYFADDARCRADLISQVAELERRYRHPYDVMHARVVDELRAGIPLQRGRSVRGMFGEFRRGDAVCRLQGGEIEDAILLEVEPASSHADRFGRMGGVQLLSDRSLTRWFLDELRHGREYGRPW